MVPVVVEMVPEDEEYWEGVARKLLVNCGSTMCIRGTRVSFEQVRRLVYYAMERGVEEVSEIARLVADYLGLEWRNAVEAVLLVLSDYTP